METNLWHFTIVVFTAFFAVMNPIANVPIFLGLTGEYSRAERNKIALNACLTALVIVIAFALLGNYIFGLFGITIIAFKITGGILIFYIGFEMLQSKKSKVSGHDMENEAGVAISPLGIPILAGPGTIVTAMNFVTSSDRIHVYIVIAVFTAMIVLTYLAFLASGLILKLLGNSIITALSKIMGLILAIIGTEMTISGIRLVINHG